MAIPDSDDQEFHMIVPTTGPYKSPFVIDKQAGTAVLPGYTELVFNQRGPTGPQGATGATGDAGATGPQGPAGGSTALDIRTRVTTLTMDDLGENADWHLVLNAGDAPGGSIPSGSVITPLATLYDLGHFNGSTFNPLRVVQVYTEENNYALHFQGTKNLEQASENLTIKFSYVFLVRPA